MPQLPDISGFIDAQDRLREALGVDATFRTPEPKVYPDGTALDPEANEPYDPTVVPISEGTDEVTIRCSSLMRLVAGMDDPTETRAAGVFSSASIALGLPAARRGEVEGASEVEVAGVTYRITDIKPDPAFNTVARYIVYGEAK